MDTGDLYDTTTELLDALGTRLDSGQARMIRLDLNAGEWRMAVDGLLATLTKREVPLTETEHGTVLALATALGFPAERTGDLRVSPPADDA